MNEDNLKYSINLKFEEIKLPPFQDVVVLGQHSLQGITGLSKSFEFLVPNSFELFEVEDGHVEAVFINKKLLTKLKSDTIIEILRERVFPYIADGELVRVDFRISLSYSNIEP